MILYFADRKMQILGQASTLLREGFTVREDLKTEDVETGVTTFSCRIGYTKESRSLLSGMTETGNYILMQDDHGTRLFTIIDQESDSKKLEIYVFAEDAGMDLLNEIAVPYMADEEHSCGYYIEKYIYDSGFEIGLNEIPSDTMKKLAWDSESTCMERVQSIADSFDAEISFSFDVQGMVITHKYINIHKRRGSDTGKILSLNREVDRIVVSKTIENLATALVCVGGTPEDSDIPVNLEGYVYDDGDFYVSGKTLYSRNALAKWSRYIWSGEPNQIAGQTGHIIRTFSFDTVSQQMLCEKAVEELKKLCQAEVNYEIDISRLPEDIRIGDTINIVDDAGELYLQSRILKLETSRAEDTCVATLGEYLIRSSGISDKVNELAAKFAEAAANRPLHTWIAYADDAEGNGISLLPDGKKYIGVAPNRLSENVSIEDPTLFSWSVIETDMEAISNAAAFVYDHEYEMVGKTACFSAHLYEGKDEVTSQYPAEQYTWYKKTENPGTGVEINELELIGTGYTCTVNTEDLGFRATVVGRFTPTTDSPLMDADDNELQTNEGDTITGRTQSEGYIKVTELPIRAPAMTDKLMGIGAELEYQMTIEDLKDLIGGAMSYSELSDKPSIEGVTLEGNKTYEELNLQRITNTELEEMLS